MPLYKIKLTDRHEVANNTFVFVFEKPAGFSFQPGQYGGFTLIAPKETDAGGITRRFSFLSTPEDSYLSFATRILPSAYKRVLNALPLGSEMKLAGPTGNFILHEDAHIPAVLFAGGIGITPFYSMIRHAAHCAISQKLILFYGNQTIQDTAFLKELMQLEQDHPHFKCIVTLDRADENWTGEKGYITHTMIKKYIPDLSIPFYYVCGAPVMVTALQELLVEMGIDENKIKVEDFPGY